MLLSCRFGKNYRRCSRNVHRIYFTVHGDRDLIVTLIAYEAGNSASFAAEDESRTTVHIDSVELVSVCFCGIYPYSRRLKLIYRGGDIDDLCNCHMLQRARRGLCCRRGKTYRAPLRNNNSVRARAFGATDDRTKVVRVFNAVKGIIGLSPKITLVEPGSLPRSEGKIRRVIDNRRK